METSTLEKSVAALGREKKNRTKTVFGAGEVTQWVGVHVLHTGSRKVIPEHHWMYPPPYPPKINNNLKVKGNVTKNVNVNMKLESPLIWAQDIGCLPCTTCFSVWYHIWSQVPPGVIFECRIRCSPKIKSPLTSSLKV